jgi:ABC-type cobalamin/Fe3+-siderophores transport system ATPase subunit
MKISYIRLENVVGIYVGSNKDFIEIDFTDSRNKIICIEGANGSGKSVLLSSLTPFASVTSVDERSTLSYTWIRIAFLVIPYRIKN